LLQTLDGWLAALSDAVAKAAWARGDLTVLRQQGHTLQQHAPDLVVQAVGPHLLWYLDGLIASDRLATLLATSHPVQTLTEAGLAQQQARSWTHTLQAVWRGHVAVVTAGVPGATLFDFAQPPHRGIGQPGTEQTIRGPQAAFVEPNAIKVAQIRQAFPNPRLRVESLTVGVRTPIPCTLWYDADLANPAVVQTLRDRLGQISVDQPLNATRVGSLIRDQPWALFPTVRYSERVDWVALQLAAGKVAVAIPGDPFVITVPATLMDFYHTAEDYSAVWYDASFVRLIRLVAWAFGVMLPGWYIALTEVNPDLISPTLFDIVSGSHTGLPFTPFVEVVVMILVVEILREAAVRLPKVLATTIGTVGAIVVGTAVVKAGFVSPQIIVLMTFTALSLFSVPTYELLASWRLVSWAILLAAFVLGIYGIVCVTLALTLELVGLRSFGVPYLVPFSPWRPKDWPNTVARIPWTFLGRRPTSSRAQDLRWRGDR
jgi:spore germination protein KA